MIVYEFWLFKQSDILSDFKLIPDINDNWIVLFFEILRSIILHLGKLNLEILQLLIFKYFIGKFYIIFYSLIDYPDILFLLISKYYKHLH